MLVMKNGKRHLMDGMELSNQLKIKTLREKETCKYLHILKADTSGDEKKISEENQKVTRDKTILQKPYQRYKYLGRTRI